MNFKKPSWISHAALTLFLGVGFQSQVLNAADLPPGPVFLEWEANPESDVAGYKVYFGTESGVYGDVIDVTGATNAVLPSVELGTTYYMTVSAYNAAGVEGPRSAELVVTAAAPEPAVSPAFAAGAPGEGSLRWRYPKTLAATAEEFTVYASEDLKIWVPAGIVDKTQSLESDDEWLHFSFPYPVDKPRMFFQVGVANAFGETR